MAAIRTSSSPLSSALHSLRAHARMCLCLVMLAMFCIGASAQTGGEGGIQGTVTDPTGASVPGVSITVTNQATNVSTERTSTSGGLYTIAPVLPGIYTVTVKGTGFETFTQKNLVVDALKLTGFNVTLTVGSQSEVITVNAAPPQLETTNASLGITIENETYSNLPLAMNGTQRDPTAFASLSPGAQTGARLPIIGGTGNYLGQLYLDGLPAETINQQADNRVVSLSVSVDAVDQFQVVTSTPPAEYSGAGATNVTLKSGGLKYHGMVADFIKNTAFDVNSFTGKALLVRNAAGALVPAGIPIDHQNEFSTTLGGHVPGTKRVFFFVAYDKYHNRGQTNPAAYTIPTLLMRQGDFTELNCGTNTACLGTGLTGIGGDPSAGGTNKAFLYDPTTNACTGSTCTRTPFQGLKGGVATYNVIPSTYLSPVAQNIQSFLPAPTNSAVSNNYVGSLPSGFDNHSTDYRVDFDINAKQRLSTIGAIGVEHYLNNFSAPFLPQPYTGGDYADIFPKVFDVEHTYTISDSMVNQFKFGYVRFFMNIRNATQNVSQYTPGALGITNLPAGQASQDFPGATFATTTAFGTAQQSFTTANNGTTSTQLTTPNNFTIVDNFQYLRGKHAITAGIQVQFQQVNNANPATTTGYLVLPFTAFSTANYAGTALSTATTGYSYASFLLGAVGGTPNITLQNVVELGGRYKPIAPYIEDTWKATSKLTVDAGLRWDYLPPYHEVKDRWSFLNPTLINPATGTPGANQFAGSYGGAGVSCQCRTPVSTYMKNFGPRLGITFQADSRTVFRAGIGHVFSQGGGVGGRVGAAVGTGQLGFNVTATGPSEVTSGINAGPSFYLNNGSYFTSTGRANTSLFGAGYAYPTAPVPGAATESLNAGNYLSAAGTLVSPSAVSYADPYFSGRAPDFTFYNFGFQEAITNSLTLGVNYVGNQSHHLYNSTAGGANIRGYWANQLNPIYLAGLGGLTASGSTSPLLTAQATPANIAKVVAAMPGVNIPAFYQAAGAVSASATIAQALVAFPQYQAQTAGTTTTGGSNGVNDTWGVNTANFSYNSLQVVVEQRAFHGLTFNANYTWSKNIGDDGTFRSGFAIPGAAISGGGSGYAQDRIERTDTTVSQRHVAHIYGTYILPFGRGELGGQNAITRAVFGGFQMGSIFTYGSGTPVAVIASSCTSPLQGQCMPDLNAAYTGTGHVNVTVGRDTTGSRTACTLGVGAGCTATQFLDRTGFATAAPVATGVAISLLGNAPRTGAYHLTNPAALTLDGNLQKTIKIHDSVNMRLQADCINLLNHTVFSAYNATWSATSTTFGQITSQTNKGRAFQVAAHLNF